MSSLESGVRRPLRRQTLPQKYHPIKRMLFSPVGLVTWIVFCLVLTYGLWQSIGVMRQSLARETEAKQRLQQEEKKALELIEKLNKADTPFAKEKIIREELQMQLPGDTVLQLPETTPPSQP